MVIFFVNFENDIFWLRLFSECLSEAESVFSLDSLSLSPHLTEIPYSTLDSASEHFDQRSFRDGGHKLGSGGFGEVFYCKLEIRGRETEVAVKALLSKVGDVRMMSYILCLCSGSWLNVTCMYWIRWLWQKFIRWRECQCHACTDSTERTCRPWCFRVALFRVVLSSTLWLYARLRVCGVPRHCVLTFGLCILCRMSLLVALT